MERSPRTDGIKTQNDTEAAERFDALVRKVLSVPHAEIMRREAEYKRQSAMNPHRRGPKSKAKPSAKPGLKTDLSRHQPG